MPRDDARHRGFRRYCRRTAAFGRGHGRVEILVHDLPVHGKQVGVYVDARRLRCQGCGKTFMETLPGVNDARRMTQRLVKWVGERSLRHTFTSIAEEIGVAEGTIRNVFADHVAELERTVKFQTPHWMGIDEIHIIRRPRAVISNLKNNTAVNIGDFNQISPTPARSA